MRKRRGKYSTTVVHSGYHNHERSFRTAQVSKKTFFPVAVKDLSLFTVSLLPETGDFNFRTFLHHIAMANLPSSWRAYYLTAYNIVQAGLWTTLFFLTLRNLSDGPILIIARLEPFARWTQTFALVDVLHAAGRLIPSGTATTFTQVGTRVIQVWAIWFAFPDAILGDRSADGNAIHGWASPSSGGIAFVALLLAWSVADAIRYTYLVCKMHHIESEILTWTR